MGFILKFCRKKHITVLKKKKQGTPIKTCRKNIPEAQQMLFCYCIFCTDGAGALKTTRLWSGLFACPRFSSGLVRRDLPDDRETALPLGPELTEGSFALFLEIMHIILLKTSKKMRRVVAKVLKTLCAKAAGILLLGEELEGLGVLCIRCMVLGL